MQFNDSVHAISDSVKEKFTCTTCHRPHVDLIASTLIDPARIVEQDNHGCLQCHDSDEKLAKFAPADGKASLLKKRPSSDDIHEWLTALKKQFLGEHLQRWIGPFTKAIQAGVQQPFYRHLAELTAPFVAMESRFDEVSG